MTDPVVVRPFALLALTLAAAAASAGARAEIFRCTTASGAVTFQELPCPAGSAGGPVAIPTDFPAADRAERERLLQREAALDARLMKRLELEAAERIAREERRARALQAEIEALRAREAAAPVVVIAWPHARPLHRPAQRHWPHADRGAR